MLGWLSLLLHELLSSGSPLAVAAPCFIGVLGKVPGVLVAAFAAFLEDLLRTFHASSRSSCLMASLMSNYFVARAVS